MDGNLPFFLTVVLAIIGWFVTLERRLNSKLSIEKHERICELVNKRIEKRLDEIQHGMEEREDQAGEFRHEMRDSMHGLAMKIEILGTQQRFSGHK